MIIIIPAACAAGDRQADSRHDVDEGAHNPSADDVV